jgi:predicted HTH transcriptional regulator
MNAQIFENAIESIKKKKRKTHVSPTSVAAYESVRKQRVTDYERIVSFIKSNPGSSREEVTHGTGIQLQSVTGDVSHLLKKGLIEERDTKLQRGRKVGRLWPPSALPAKSAN